MHHASRLRSVRVHVTACGIALTCSGKFLDRHRRAEPNTTPIPAHLPSVVLYVQYLDAPERSWAWLGLRFGSGDASAFRRPRRCNEAARRQLTRSAGRCERSGRHVGVLECGWGGGGLVERDSRGESQGLAMGARGGGASEPGCRGNGAIARSSEGMTLDRMGERAKRSLDGLDGGVIASSRLGGGQGIGNGDHSGSRTSELGEKRGTLARVSGLSEARSAHGFVFELRLRRQLQTGVRRSQG